MPKHKHKRHQRATKPHRDRRPSHPKSPEARHFEITADAAHRYHVPVWLLWGIAGAESTWGQGGSNIFGLLAAAEGVNTSDWNAAANQAAKTLAGLKKQYGSWSAAVAHYSGNSYTIQHPGELAAGNPPPKDATVSKATAGQQTQFVGLGEDILGEGPAGHVLENFLNPLHLQPFNHGKVGGPELNPFQAEGGGGLLSFPEEFGEAANATVKLVETLLSPQFWIRVGQAIAGLILLYMGLHALTGQGPSTGAVKSYAQAAAFKALPPRQKVKG